VIFYLHPGNVLPICYGVCAAENSEKGIDVDFAGTNLLVLCPVDALIFVFSLVLNLFVAAGFISVRRSCFAPPTTVAIGIVKLLDEGL
jgi:hypothetical protein